MTIVEYADIVQSDLVLRRYHNQGSRWVAAFENAEIGRGGILESAYGNGTSPSAAIADYAKKLRGQKLIFNAHTDRRREFGVPDSLQATP